MCVCVLLHFFIELLSEQLISFKTVFKNINRTFSTLFLLIALTWRKFEKLPTDKFAIEQIKLITQHTTRETQRVISRRKNRQCAEVSLQANLPSAVHQWSTQLMTRVCMCSSNYSKLGNMSSKTWWQCDLSDQNWELMLVWLTEWWGQMEVSAFAGSGPVWVLPCVRMPLSAERPTEWGQCGVVAKWKQLRARWRSVPTHGRTSGRRCWGERVRLLLLLGVVAVVDESQRRQSPLPPAEQMRRRE